MVGIRVSELNQQEIAGETWYMAMVCEQWDSSSASNTAVGARGRAFPSQTYHMIPDEI